MKHKTTVTTEHRIVLEPEEWFTIQSRSGRQTRVNVEEIRVGGYATETGEQRWEIVLYGHRVLKDGARGGHAKMSTWEHTQSWNDESRQALWSELPLSVTTYLTKLGVSA